MVVSVGIDMKARDWFGNAEIGVGGWGFGNADLDFVHLIMVLLSIYVIMTFLLSKVYAVSSFPGNTFLRPPTQTYTGVPARPTNDSTSYK